ncbi:hypothetical protein IE81DRAFT_157565 [Ceraceosorus guamensis]|uniref:Calcium-dependent phosphotriesterase n=1 Tax=Ceraceosorus guamensis TaxID=1522189 RepID=A0A316VVQ0_9BASI|nr:hypothetical protein IE81DRAFT_157565 [Ceraceosorus guamensis]PWN41727.1 hypothetical protein IE81DRAFT_157565 [Ceraceosorus guamensis]
MKSPRVLRAGSTTKSPSAASAAPQKFRWTSFALFAGSALLAHVLLARSWYSRFLIGPSLPDHWVRNLTYTPGSLTHPAQAEQRGDPQCHKLRAARADARARRGTQSLNFCEDVLFLEGLDHEGDVTPLLLATCDPGRGEWNTVMGPLKEPQPRGGLWVWDPANPSAEPVLLSPSLNTTQDPFPDSFHPLGAAMYPSSSGDEPSTLLVVNHASTHSTIEVFSISIHGESGVPRAERIKLSHRGTISDALATHTPNSIAMLSQDSFLVTNDHLFALRPPPREQVVNLLQALRAPHWLALLGAAVLTNPILSQILPRIETFMGLKLGWVARVQMQPSERTSITVTSALAAQGIAFANGISVSPKGTTIAVASTTLPGVVLYSPHLDGDGKPDWSRPLEKRGTIHTPQTPDNLSFSSSDHLGARSLSHTTQGNSERVQDDPFDASRLVVAGHPHPLRLVGMARTVRSSRPKRAGSWVIDILPASSTLSKSVAHLRDDTTDDSMVRSTRYAPIDLTKSLVKPNAAEWVVRSLYLSTDGAEPGTPSSAGAEWLAGKEHGTLVISGLYGGVMVCTKVAT